MPKNTKPASTTQAPGQRQLRDLEELQRWHARCQPAQPVTPGDELYVELENPEHTLPGAFRLRDLKQPIYFKPEGSCQLFLGYSGTGKSTTLRKLQSELEEEGYVVLLADADQYLDLGSPLELVDLLVVFAGAFGDAAEKRLGLALPSFWPQLGELLAQHLELDTDPPELLALNLKLSLRQGNVFWEKARTRLAVKPGELEALVRGFIADTVVRIRRHYNQPGRQVVFILDSLDRLRATLGFTALMESALRIFAGNVVDLRLPNCHVVYSVPPYLPFLVRELSGKYDRVSEILTAVPVELRVEQDPSRPLPNEAGIAMLRELVDRRVPVAELFGPNRAQLDRLILASGGNVRTLVFWLRELVYEVGSRGTPVGPHEVDQLLSYSGSTYRQGILKAHIPVLGQLLEQGSLEGLSQEAQPRVAELIGRYLDLAYQNGDGSYNIHPLVRDYVGQQNTLHA